MRLRLHLRLRGRGGSASGRLGQHLGFLRNGRGGLGIRRGGALDSGNSVGPWRGLCLLSLLELSGRLLSGHMLPRARLRSRLEGRPLLDGLLDRLLDRLLLSRLVGSNNMVGVLRRSLLRDLLKHLLGNLLSCGRSHLLLLGNVWAASGGDGTLRLAVQCRSKLRVGRSPIHGNVLAHFGLISGQRRRAGPVAREKGVRRGIGNRGRDVGCLGSSKRVFVLVAGGIARGDLFLPLLRDGILRKAPRGGAGAIDHAVAEPMVGVCLLLIPSTVYLGLELITLLDVEGEPAVDGLVRVVRMPLRWLGVVALLQRRVLGIWRGGGGLGMARPDIALAVIVKGTIEPGLSVRAGQLRVDGASIEEVRVGVAAVGGGALVEHEAGAAKLVVVPGLARKAARVPATDGAAMGLVHGLHPAVKRGVT